jgi:hypothetical protein
MWNEQTAESPQGNEITYSYSVVPLNFVAINFRGVAENEMLAYFLLYRFSAPC